MPMASRTTASETVEVPGYEGHLEDFDGGYTVAFERSEAGRRGRVRAVAVVFCTVMWDSATIARQKTDAPMIRW